MHEYASRHPHWLLDLASDGPTYSISHSITRLPEIKDVPYLGCVASETEARTSLILTCVNRQLTGSATAEIDLSKLPRTTGAVSVTTIPGDNLLVENDESALRHIAPINSTEHLQNSAIIRHTFPEESVTVLEVALSR